ncbi:MAG: GGDEF domain-containing protein [Lachnospira sp.]|nr:GGDEF domain-containing protein [Lachnospira sp.]
MAQLTYLKETDSLTRLFNKNKYNEMVSMYYPNVNNITVIFWDLNNLKIINDTYGHEYGDKALSALASVLYAHSDEQCRRVYRFGGDEFVMIIDNPHDGEADRIISAVKDELVKRSSDILIEISSAVGVASGNGSNIIEIVKNADSAMYADKQLCHHR